MVSKVQTAFSRVLHGAVLCEFGKGERCLGGIHPWFRRHSRRPFCCSEGVFHMEAVLVYRGYTAVLFLVVGNRGCSLLMKKGESRVVDALFSIHRLRGGLRT